MCPSKSQAQHNTMALAATDPKRAKKLGFDIPQEVGEEFMKADKGKTFSKKKK